MWIVDSLTKSYQNFHTLIINELQKKKISVSKLPTLETRFTRPAPCCRKPWHSSSRRPPFQAPMPHLSALGGKKYQQSMFILIKNVLLRAFKVFLQFGFFVVIDMIHSTHRVTDSVLAVVNCHGQSIYYNKHVAKKGGPVKDIPLFVFFALKTGFRTCRVTLVLSQLKIYYSITKNKLTSTTNNNKLCI